MMKKFPLSSMQFAALQLIPIAEQNKRSRLCIKKIHTIIIFSVVASTSRYINSKISPQNFFFLSCCMRNRIRWIYIYHKNPTMSQHLHFSIPLPPCPFQDNPTNFIRVACGVYKTEDHKLSFKQLGTKVSKWCNWQGFG